MCRCWHTLILQKCELNKPVLFIKYQVCSILSEQQKDGLSLTLLPFLFPVHLYLRHPGIPRSYRASLGWTMPQGFLRWTMPHFSEKVFSDINVRRLSAALPVHHDN